MLAVLRSMRLNARARKWFFKPLLILSDCGKSRRLTARRAQAKFSLSIFLLSLPIWQIKSPILTERLSALLSPDFGQRRTNLIMPSHNLWFGLFFYLKNDKIESEVTSLRGGSNRRSNPNLYEIASLRSQ